MKANDFLCLKCGQINECFYTEDEEENDLECLNCGSTSMKKQLSACNIGGRYNNNSPSVPMQPQIKTHSCEDGDCPIHVESVPATIHLPEGDTQANVIRITHKDEKDEKIH
ncbi:hypothetical protein ACFL2U_01470 [Patescibacteria group bacterium]